MYQVGAADAKARAARQSEQRAAAAKVSRSGLGETQNRVIVLPAPCHLSIVLPFY